MVHLIGNRVRLFGAVALGAAVLAVAFVGCSGESNVPAPEKPAAKVDGAAPGKTVAAQTVSRQRLQKPFKQAVLLDPPDGQLRPPDRTAGGKNVAQIFEAVAGKANEGGLWDQVDFFDAQGRRLKHTAILKTDLGDIHIELLPEAAPHHVTSFIALARAGYYDGLPFHASQRAETGGNPLAYLESGCPKGTGERGYGSVGYWLEPEIDRELVHGVGTVGAWHFSDESDTDAGRFYITLHPAPWMDGDYTIFGKVTRGLDVADTINKRPVFDEVPFDRPKEPVVIRQVTIQSAPGG
jgi:peptidyl-prolyl cis-trans isomerase B (cyclophilin B)